MELGKIAKINTELTYGFVEIPKIGKVFFNIDTKFSNVNFSDLREGMKVTVDITNTERGLFARSLTNKEIKVSIIEGRNPEVSI